MQNAFCSKYLRKYKLKNILINIYCEVRGINANYYLNNIKCLVTKREQIINLKKTKDEKAKMAR